ncbi:MAG: 16S rRNA (adenine(1518)-N(6)/adenine(1519)-N(6))-dimethyltransferase RsmA [Candidatus Omnitrophica bacterium]|nr:16S rRNA (adenine(1518)-N(6)/adenine(1519)-N(6))-dimethyltransferase RsmA [Candidatus Omnitrophota bacterium]
MLTITRVRELLKSHNLRPNKRLGQNFLIDRNIANKIIAAAGPKPGGTLFEIGAGLGNITADLAGLAGRVIAVEFDKGLCAVLQETLKGCANLEIFCADILKFDFAGALRNGRATVIGNLPYYITTPILERLIENRRAISGAVLMVQKEVGERLTSAPGSKVYGSLSCYLGFYAKIEFLGVVSRSSFFPQPEVDSVLLRLDFLDKPAVAVKDEELLFKVIRAAFNQRRKTIQSSLSHKKISGFGRQEVTAALNRAGIPGRQRPEMLNLQEFARIADELYE